MEVLHPPLKDLLKLDFDINEWNKLYLNDYLRARDMPFQDDYSEGWHFPGNEIDSFYKCICHKKEKGDGGISIDLNVYKRELITFMERLEDVADITDEAFFAQLSKPGSETSTTEIFAVSKRENWGINVKDPATADVVTYNNESCTEVVDFVVFDGYFIIKML
jgi:hypothetical protein